MLLEFCGNAPKQEYIRLGVKENNLVDELVFVLAQKQGKIDLYEYTPKIKICNDVGDYAEYTSNGLVVETVTERETLKITFTLDELVTAQGNVQMQLSFEKTADSKTKVWQTLPFFVTFPDGINASDSVIGAYPNIIKELTDKTAQAVKVSDGANTAAASAVATAQKAEETASDAKQSASNAEVYARGVADNENNRIATENERVAAENIRNQNESQRQANETARQERETTRLTSETTRVENELLRKTAESTRVDNENARKQNETARGNAEGQRVSAEKQRATNETDRTNAETARSTAEGKRVQAEIQRTQNETARGNAEGQRVSAETARGNAETARVNAENQRAQNESQRQANETARVAAENARQAALDGKLNRQTNDGSVTEVYAFKGQEQTKKQVAQTPTAGAISAYDNNGNLKTGAPQDDNDCVRKIDITNLVDGVDKYFAALLNDTNTTETFYAWYDAAKTDDTTRYQLLERFFKMCALNNDQTHTVRFYSANVSSDPKGTPLDWLADKKAQALATDAGIIENANSWLDAEGNTRKDGEDWASENRLTWYVRVNALSQADGTMDVLAIEGIDDGFDITGELAPVYTFQLSPWYKETDDGEYCVKSWRANPAEGYAPFNNNIDLDGNPRVMTWHASFGGANTTDGKLTSGAGKIPANYTSASGGLTLARKWNAYEAVGADANAKWVLSEWQHRHFNKENSDIANGCLSYSWQYRTDVAETNTTRVLLTTSQANNVIVGSAVIVGDNSATTAPDRGAGAAYNLSKHAVKVLSIETVTVNDTEYKAINLALDAPITTTTTTWLSSMPWFTGETDKIVKHHDGSPVSLTNAKYPLRVAGMEVLIGAYFIGLDVLYSVKANATSGFDYQIYECKNSEKIASSITQDYSDTGIALNGVAAGWRYPKDFIQTTKPVLFPSMFGGSTTGYVKSAFYGSNSAGVRCPWRFGHLNHGVGFGGLACELAYSAPTASAWYGVPWLTGAEKKRGEYTG